MRFSSAVVGCARPGMKKRPQAAALRLRGAEKNHHARYHPNSADQAALVGLRQDPGRSRSRPSQTTGSGSPARLREELPARESVRLAPNAGSLDGTRPCSFFPSSSFRGKICGYSRSENELGHILAELGGFVKGPGKKCKKPSAKKEKCLDKTPRGRVE